MDHQSKLKRAQEIQVAIGQILLQEWDPIGIREEPEAQDEYESYVGGVYRLLAEGASPETVAEHLYLIEAEQMGYTQAKPVDLLPIAQRLCALDVRLERG
jgi:hypothetical protein